MAKLKLRKKVLVAACLLVGVTGVGAGVSSLTSHEQEAQVTSNQNDELMSGITISEPENVAYSRQEYQDSWSVGSGCDIRSRILTKTSLVPVTFGSNGLHR